MKPLLSVVMLNYNGKRYLEQALDSVFKSNYPNFEVILVDNASQDGSMEYVKQVYRHPRNFKIVENDANYGFAEGNNIGINYVNKGAKYIVFLNMDVVVDPMCLDELVNLMEANPDVGATQCKVLLMSDRSTIDSAGHFLDFLGYTYQRGENERDRGQYNSVGEIFYPYGAAFILRRSVVNHITLDRKLFDPKYFCYHEDADLGWRIRLGGYRVLYSPSSVVFHSKGGTDMRYDVRASAGTSSIVFHLTKNRMTTLLRNYGLYNVIKFFPILSFLEISRALLMIPFMPKHSTATLNALIWVFKNLKRTLRKRQLVQECIRRVPDSRITQFMVRPDLMYNVNKLRFYAKLADKLGTSANHSSEQRMT